MKAFVTDRILDRTRIALEQDKQEEKEKEETPEVELPPPEGLPRRFALARIEDETGVSGTGIVAFGIKWPDGSCALRWTTDTASTAVYDSLAHLKAVHGHNGKTLIKWIDVLEKKENEQKNS